MEVLLLRVFITKWSASQTNKPKPANDTTGFFKSIVPFEKLLQQQKECSD